METLITGGLGFIGSHLTMALLNRGLQPIILDNINDFTDPKLKMERLQELQKCGLAHFEKVDVLDRDKLHGVFRRYPHIRTVIHLAALPGVGPSLREPALYVDQDIKATVQLMEAMKQHDIRRFIFASSSSVYGEGRKTACRESDADGTNLVSPYAMAKWSAELYVRMYTQLYGWDTSTLRFFTVYGPGQREDMAIAKFVRALCEGLPITLYGPETYRDYTYVDDIIVGIQQALEHLDGFQVYNLGSEHPVSLKSLMEHIEKITELKTTLHMAKQRLGDVQGTWADCTKARERLGYQAQTPIVDGLFRYYEWYLQQPQRRLT